MAKKKKTALKPVARGFATTSQPKKVVAEPETEDSTVPEDGAPPTDSQDGVLGVNGTNRETAEKAAEGLDWEDDSKLEEGIYQGYVERLQEKGDREVAKILKVSPCLRYNRIHRF
jgi:ATP-dependent RNA helicase DHX29